MGFIWLLYLQKFHIRDIKMVDLSYPRQVVLVTSRAEVKDKFSTNVYEKDNVLAVDWHMPVSMEPKMYAIAIGKNRFSANLIKDSGFFCVNFISNDLTEVVKYVGTQSGEHIDKFAKTGLETIECNTLACFAIKDSVGFIECELVNQVDSGDHIIFIGKVVHTTVNDEKKRCFHIKSGNNLGILQ